MQTIAFAVLRQLNLDFTFSETENYTVVSPLDEHSCRQIEMVGNKRMVAQMKTLTDKNLTVSFEMLEILLAVAKRPAISSPSPTSFLSCIACIFSMIVDKYK